MITTYAHAVRFLPFLPSKKTISPKQFSERQERIDAYNAQAIELFEDGHFEEAQELWEKAIKVMESIEPSEGQYYELKDVKGPATDDETDTRSVSDITGDVDEMYEEAVALFRKQRYVAAKKLFKRVEARIPDHKATRNYLSILEHKIKQTQQSLSSDKIQHNVYSRQAERDEWHRILKESENELEKKIEQQVEPIYKEALEHYKKRRFALAKDYFDEIDSIKPGYKDTTKYLARVDADIEEEQQRIAKEDYQKKVLARKQEHEEWQKVIKESEEKLAERMREQAEPIYQEALFYYKQREFELAQSHFEEVEMIVPGYKAVPKYLGRIEQDIQKEILRRQQIEVKELARRQKQEADERKREEERLARLQAKEDQLRIQQFRDEVAARRLERREWLKVLEEGEKERKRKLQEQADFVYQEAIELYKKRMFKQAKEDFLEVEQVLPNYKSTGKYLSRIDKEIEEEDKLQLIAQQRLMQRQMREEHYAELQEQQKLQVKRAIADERRLLEFQERSAARQEKRDEWDRVLNKAQAEKEIRLKEEAEFVYREALMAFKDKNWDRARSGFIEADEILPGYKKAARYIARIDRNVQKEQEHIQKEIARSNEELRREEEMARKKEEARQRQAAKADQIRQKEYNNTQANIAYRFALSLYERQKYVQAKDKFLEVQELVPDYKATARYLARIDTDIRTAQQLDQRDQKLASRQEFREKEMNKLREVEKVMEVEERRMFRTQKKEAKARERERREWERSMHKIEQENKKRLQQQADSVYKEAMRYYDAGWFKQARETFREVEAIQPGYRSVHKYLSRIEDKIDKERRVKLAHEQKIEEQLIDAAITDKKENLMAETWRRELAEGSVRQVPVDPQQGNMTYQFIPRAEDSIELTRAVEEREKTIAENAEIKYREAIDSYKAKRFIEAKLKFIEVETLSPGYKATVDYLGRIDERIATQKDNLAVDEYARSVARESSLKYKDDPINERRHNLIQQALTFEERSQDRSKGQEGADVRVAGWKDKRTTQKSWEEQVRDRRKELKKQRESVNKLYNKQFRELYNRAVRLYRNHSYIEAKQLFVQIDRIKPGYKKTSSYIKKANLKIAKGLQKKVETEVARQEQSTIRANVVGAALDAFE